MSATRARSAHSFRPFRQRDPLAVGLASLAVIGLLLYAAFNLSRLPVLSGSTEYTAAFTEAGGLKAGNDVRIAGVKVGKVEDVTLAEGRVRVTFRVGQSIRLRGGSRLRTEIASLLGNKYLGIRSEGSGQWPPEREFPLTRTTAPFDVVPALHQLTRNLAAIDTKRLAGAFDALSGAFADAPPAVRASLDGVSRLSASIATRDQQLAQLLTRTEQVSRVLAERSPQLVRLVRDGDLLLREIQARRQVIHSLLVHTHQVCQQLAALVAENQASIGPALDHLRGVVAVLERNQANLATSLHRMYPTFRLLMDATGNGPWIDGAIQNIAPLPVGVAPGPGLKPPPHTLGALLGVAPARPSKGR